MSSWITLKQQARQWHKTLLLKSGGDPSAMALLNAATEITGIQRFPLPATDPLLMGADAILDPEANIIFFNQDIDTKLAVFYQMHEFAHHKLHDGSWSCKREDINPEASEEEIPLGIAMVETYNAHEKAEREANVYAREVLLPSDTIRTWFIEDGIKASQIAARINVPDRMVQHQMSFSLLVSNLISEPVDFEQSPPSASLDTSQRIVAEWTGGPLLVEAGPGTGKTKTLVGRIEFLLTQNVHPTSILSLTFSNKAAEEMRSRVAIASRDVAHQIWMGTFHAFGLELLRKYGFKIGIKPDFTILDPIDGIFLLEERLQSLNLVHYRNLYDPTMYLPDILSAISRAKDELVDPDSYMALAADMIISAGSDEKKRTAGEKAVEVAHVYKIYQQHLESESLLDFGDLIFRSVLLLQGNPDVSEDIRSMYTHILVDEYQDVNRASGVLLREVAHSGSGLWVVGDTRQSIYRFRGAAPTNMQKFDEDFPAATKKLLEVNYRSRPAVIKTFATLAPKMKATLGASFIPWKPHRDSEPGAVKMEIADNLDAEVSGIAREIQHRKSSGCNFRDQAILCRSHTTMARLGSRLEATDVPILYLGDLFEREEIRDILSLLSLTSKGDGRGLVRVSDFPEYQIPISDVTTLFSYAKENDIPFPRAIEMAKNVADISKDGKKGLMLLASHLEGIDYITSAWEMLVRYLFDRSSYLESLLVDNSLAAQQKRLAIHQFLEFAHDQRNNSSSNSSDPKRVFLEYVRRLEIHGEERHLRQVPDWASGIDAVRLLSVHASKGLEFDSVFIPYLGKGFFPARKQGKHCPPPDKMLPPNMVEGSHEEEEECLFFVALSRARDYICLSRAARYGEKESNPSDLLEPIKTCLPRNYGGSPTWMFAQLVAASQIHQPLSADNPVFEVQHLDIYIKCPRKYYYESILGLRGKSEATAYLRFHRCVYGVVRWIGEERTAGNAVDASVATAKLAEVWAKDGPCNHAYELFYRETADNMVALAANRTAKVGTYPTWEVQLKSGRVQVKPDLLEAETENDPTVIRFRTGKPSSSEADKDIYAIYQTAVEKESNGRGKVAIYYLSTGDTEEIKMTSRKLSTRLSRYEDAIAGIRSQHFQCKPNDRECPRCAYYFICSSSDET